MYKILFSLLCIPLILNGNTAQKLDSKALINLALENNINLQQASYKIEIARAKAELSGRIDNPELGLRYGDDFFFENENNSAFEVSFSQTFPLTDRLSKEKEISKIAIELASLEIEEQKWLLAQKLHSQILEVQVIDLRIELTKQLIDHVQKLNDFVDEKVETGEVSSLDANQTRLELRKLQQDLLNLESGKQKELADIKPLIGEKPDFKFELEDKLKPRVEALTIPAFSEEFVQHRPDYKMAELGLKNAEARMELAKTSNWDEITIELFFENETSQESTNNTVDEQKLGLGFSIPLPFWSKQKASISEQLASRNIASKRIEALKLNILNEVEATRVKLLNLQSQLEHYQTDILQLAEENLKATQKAYNNGQYSLFQVLRAQQSRIELENTYIDTLAEYHSYRLDLLYMIGDEI